MGVREQLGDQAALAHARLADDRDQLHGALLGRALERCDQKRLLKLAPDERRFELASDVAAIPGACRLRAPELKHLRLPLHGDRRQPFVLEHPARGSVRVVGDREAVHRRRALDASGRVDDVAGNNPLPPLRASTERYHRLTRVDPYPHLQVETGIGLVQLHDRIKDRKARAYRPLGVVLVRHRSAAHSHHRVADELLHRGAVTLDLPTQARMVGPDASAHVLRVLLLRSGGEADQVTEQH